MYDSQTALTANYINPIIGDMEVQAITPRIALDKCTDSKLYVAMNPAFACSLCMGKSLGLPKTLAYILREWKSAQGDTGHAEIDMITSIYAHILDEDRKVNAQKFETAFYANPDLRGFRPPEEPKEPEPAPADLTSLAEQLQKSPELASALAALIAMTPAGR